MKALAWSSLVVCISLGTVLSAVAQTPVGALAIDERQGAQYGWAVDYETASAAQAAALRECGAGCSVVLTFARCGAYAADQDADSTAVGWAGSGLHGPGVGLQHSGRVRGRWPQRRCPPNRSPGGA